MENGFNFFLIYQAVMVADKQSFARVQLRRPPWIVEG